MQILSRIHSMFKAFFRRQKMESEMSDELRFHLEARTNDLMAQRGLSRPASSLDLSTNIPRPSAKTVDSGSRTHFGAIHDTPVANSGGIPVLRSPRS